MQLRPYQIVCLNNLKEAVAKGEKRLLVKAPCSFGKTIVFCHIATSALSKGNKTLIIVDSVFLVEQTVIKLRNFTKDVGIYCGSLNKREIKSITVGTIQSVKETDFDVLVVDEVHSGLSRTKKFLEGFKGIVIGFTATPFNAKGIAIYGSNNFFKRLHFSMMPKELLELGIITPMKYGAEKEETKVDLKSVKVVGGDYKESELQKVYEIEKDKVNLQVEDMIARTKNRNKVIIMTTGIAHAEYVASILPSSLSYHSEKKQNERSDILNKFEHGDIKYLIGVMAIYKGLDITSVDCIVNMRPTRSRSFFVQLCGRGVRKHDGKDYCYLLDYGQTVEQLGFYEDIGEVSRSFNKGIAPELYPKMCPECSSWVKPQIRVCECGFVFTIIATGNLTKEAFHHEEIAEGIVKDVVVSETYYWKPTFAAITVVLYSGKAVEFLYTKKYDWKMRQFEKHRIIVTSGSKINWKVDISGSVKYFNIVSVQ